MSSAWLARALWTAALLALVTGTIEARRRSVRLLSAATPPLLPAIPVAPARPSADSLESAAEQITDRNLFRPERTSAERHKTATPAMPLVMPQPPSAKPRLVLRGVLGGPPWDAIIEGIPGREGSVVVRAGQSFGGITVRAVHRDTAFARGFDTTWTLTLAKTWQ